MRAECLRAKVGCGGVQRQAGCELVAHVVETGAVFSAAERQRVVLERAPHDCLVFHQQFAVQAEEVTPAGHRFADVVNLEPGMVQPADQGTRRRHRAFPPPLSVRDARA
jgi:hypothetical protein